MTIMPPANTDLDVAKKRNIGAVSLHDLNQALDKLTPGMLAASSTAINYLMLADRGGFSKARFWAN